MTADRYAAFLRETLPRQPKNLEHYRLGDGQVWIKKAGPRNGPAGYVVLGLLARAARLEVLRAVPNRGGARAIATEARRLRDLAARGLRVPAVLAVQEDGLMISHLGVPGAPTPALDAEMRDAVPAGAGAVLGPWRDGLAAIAGVHAAGTALSQGFARNMVRCPDGAIGFVDFEDDPLAVLPLAHCQVRDALYYAHSSALYLAEAGALAAARGRWQDWVAARPAAVRGLLAKTVARMRWLGRLPADRRWGRDLQRARAAHDLMA
ncbi:hypothetical protein [Xylophilus sp.]|uniref:hypothetical protein n=1 Tax=Xylophilus sp. TaxID=2653893 RepID=UPI0013BD4625|nr:hypothetical protein [Xylophilus sp.]KAF1044708.1 MAG: hypothetical protein GAK38_03426 [Xylophilus sp.]